MSTAAQALDRHAQLHTRAAWAFLLAACAVCVLYVAVPSAAVSAAGFGAVAGGSVVAIGVGMRQHRPQPLLPWWCLGAASVLFLSGGVLRTLARTGVPLSGYAPAGFTLSGYAAVAVALVWWLRARNVHANRDTALDTLLVGVGAALASWALLIAPVAAVDKGFDPTTVITALYPVADAVLLTLLVHLAFTTAPGDHAFGLLATSLIAIFLGDLGYAATSAGLATFPPSLLDAPFLIGFGALGAGALHPSMIRLSIPQPQLPYRGRRRVYGITVALVLAALTLALIPPANTTDRVVRAALFAALLLGVLLRSERAVRRHAASDRAAQYRSTHDELTGLPNRTLLHTQTGQRLAARNEPGRVSLLFLDLDGFKFVNDSYGHSVGDELLVAAAQRLTSIVRPEDIVARYGGDEFVVATHLERAGAEGLAERILTVLGEPFTLSVGRVFVSASIGIARTGATSRGGAVEGLIREADAAMYHAKTRDRGSYAFYDDSLRARARIQIETSTALRDALARDEFEVYYQPIITLSDHRTTGYEALLRWHHDGRTHPPDEFIPIAEASNIIIPIGAWVLRTACAQLATWWAAGHRTLHMAVNISARQLRDDALIAAVRTTLAETGLPASALWLELTETALIADVSAALRTLTALHKLGVVICVDDFGTGYSALGYLQRFPMSVVKIDGSFVQALSEDRPEASLVSAIEKMATALGLRTIAEGVETELQEHQISTLGCDMAQGWLYGHPQPAHDVALPSHDVAS